MSDQNQNQTTDYVVCGPDYFAGLREGAKQERERCARIAENWISEFGTFSSTGEAIAAQIREEP